MTRKYETQYGKNMDCDVGHTSAWKGGEHMAKVSRTYRLSGIALAAIEERDRNAYPTASDFVEGMLVKERNERKAVSYTHLTLPTILRV